VPELPEVEAHARRVRRWTAGRSWVGLRVVDPTAARASLSTRPSDGGAALGDWAGPCGEVLRVAKRIGLVRGVGSSGALVHLGMTGHLSRVVGDDVPRFGRVGWRLDDGSTIWLVDARRFGCVVPVADVAGAIAEGLGPDADAFPDGPSLAARFRGCRGPIKPALLDQARVGGLGNIHAGEALWRIGVHPRRPVPAVPEAAWAALAAGLPGWLEAAVLQEGPDHDGDLRYVSEGGDNPFFVYDREGQPCPRCAAPIQREVVGGRGSWWCPACQPAPCGSAAVR
jgi:formamidopyrimidine-DNA glycosylase